MALHLKEIIRVKSKNGLSQNNKTNELDHIYLMRLKSSMVLYVKETIRVSARKT